MSEMNNIITRLQETASKVTKNVLGDSMFLSPPPTQDNTFEADIINMVDLPDDRIAEMHSYFAAFTEYTTTLQAQKQIMFDLAKNELDLLSKKDESYPELSRIVTELKMELTIAKGLCKKYAGLAKATHYELVSRCNNEGRRG